MARPGPPPEPTYLKLVKGNPGKRPLGNEPQHTVVCPAPPEWLNDYAQAEWARLAPILASRGLLTDAWLGTFEALIEAYGDWRQAADEVKAKGMTMTTQTGYEQVRPAVGVKVKARDAYVKIGALFGLSPAENGRLNLPGDHGDAIDPMEAALM